MSVSGQLKGVLIPIIEEWWSNRQLGTIPAGNDYDRLGNAIANLLELPNLPADLREAIHNHLIGMFADKRILAPQWCRRLYAPLAELNQSSESLEPNATIEPANTDVIRSVDPFPTEPEGHPIEQSINGEASGEPFPEASTY